jgi:CheY-like chemotaxis protein
MEEGPRRAEAEAQENKAAPPKRRILVVDDNRDSATSLGMILSLLGNEIRTAHDGLEGVEAAAAFRPDLILLDIGLPKLNGYEACRRIREQPWGQGVVIIACTGWGQEEDVRRSNEAGFDQHMVKPLDPAQLEKVLAEIVVTREGFRRSMNPLIQA